MIKVTARSLRVISLAVPGLVSIFCISVFSQSAVPKKMTSIRSNVSGLRDPTREYRIGPNDVIRVDLANVGGAPKFLRVDASGAIAMPLTEEKLIVVGHTAAETGALMARAMRLSSHETVVVRVRDCASHVINVWGLVDAPGERQIQRDAIPFYVVRAGSTIDTRAARVRIVRNRSTTVEEYRLTDERLDSVIVFPGDSIEFAAPGPVGHF